MSTTILSTDEDLNQIAKAIIDLDRDKLMTLLTDDCEIQDVYLKSVEVKREEFINWIFKRYNEFIAVEPVNYRINICNHCEVGSRVILFNEGRFPFLSWMSKSMSYAAYNVEKIGGFFRLSFCFNYAGCVQKGFFERNKAALIKADEIGGDVFEIAKDIFKRETGQNFEMPENTEFLERQKKLDEETNRDESME